MIFSRCIVREPCPEMVGGLTNAGLGLPDFTLAKIQHKAYVEALRTCGCTAISLAAEPQYPDSVFVEDTALLIIGELAILSRPGAESRRGETALMKPVLEEFFPVIEVIKAPGTLDAGDVLEAGQHYFIGLSKRTNAKGAEQLIHILEKHGKTGSTISLKKFLHLKTGVAYLGNNSVLLAGELKHCPAFADFIRFEVDDDEEYAANSIMLNGTLLMPAGYPKILDKLVRSGYHIIQVDTSEFQKLDGGISCLSLRF